MPLQPIASATQPNRQREPMRSGPRGRGPELSGRSMSDTRRLVTLIRGFLDGSDSMSHVAEIEGEFAQHLDDGERFSGLAYALAVYRGTFHEEDVQRLRLECAWSIKELEREAGQQRDGANKRHPG